MTRPTQTQTCIWIGAAAISVFLVSLAILPWHGNCSTDASPLRCSEPLKAAVNMLSLIVVLWAMLGWAICDRGEESDDAATHPPVET